MKKTSVYLSVEDRERLARLAERKGESQAWVLREALLAYDAGQPDRDFQIFKMADEPGAAEFPHFDDPQDFNDWLDDQMKEGLLKEYSEQLEDAQNFFEARKLNS